MSASTHHGHVSRGQHFRPGETSGGINPAPAHRFSLATPGFLRMIVIHEIGITTVRDAARACFPDDRASRPTRRATIRTEDDPGRRFDPPVPPWGVATAPRDAAGHVPAPGSEARGRTSSSPGPGRATGSSNWSGKAGPGRPRAAGTRGPGRAEDVGRDGGESGQIHRSPTSRQRDTAGRSGGNVRFRANLALPRRKREATIGKVDDFLSR
jgi:hypothetical protein